MMTQKALHPARVAHDPIGETHAPYSAREFLADGRLVLAGNSATPNNTPCFVESLDGKLVSIETDSLLEAAREWREVLSIFCNTYGLEEGPDRASRFYATLEFLEEHGDAILRAGLAYDRRPMKLYREFVEFLLNHHEGPGQRHIPGTALPRFLDEWGHRWI